MRELQWRTDFSPSGDPAAQARALWATRSAGAAINRQASRRLWADRARLDLLALVQDLQVPVLMVAGADDPRPWSATDDLAAVLSRAHRVVLEHAGHAPWAEQPTAVQLLLLRALREADVRQGAGSSHC